MTRKGHPPIHVTARKSATHKDYPEDFEGCQRAINHVSGNYIEKTPEGTKCSMIVHLDLTGSIPSMILGKMAEEMPKQLFAKLSTVLK